MLKDFSVWKKIINKSEIQKMKKLTDKGKHTVKVENHSDKTSKERLKDKNL